jgi:hypothetical protein
MPKFPRRWKPPERRRGPDDPSREPDLRRFGLFLLVLLATWLTSANAIALLRRSNADWRQATVAGLALGIDVLLGVLSLTGW